ncbi:hypothetical protein D3C76_1445960 [compost metagenome]
MRVMRQGFGRNLTDDRMPPAHQCLEGAGKQTLRLDFRMPVARRTYHQINLAAAQRVIIDVAFGNKLQAAQRRHFPQHLQ